MKDKFYITTAITYTSGKPHIGNTYEAVFSDAIARFKRAQGFDVFFMTGTDEHGLKVEQKAAEKGVTPKQFVDGVAGEIRRIWDLMDVSYDKFIRTTDEDHVKAVQKAFKKFYEQGDIYKGAYEGMYCTPRLRQRSQARQRRSLLFQDGQVCKQAYKTYRNAPRIHTAGIPQK